jgi:hypothetical protein
VALDNMTGKIKTPGQLVDELIINSRRLNVAHFCFGLASAFIFWVRPGTFRPHLPRPLGRGPAFSIVADTVIAWLPYIVSWQVSRALLSGRDTKATIAFIICGATIAALSVGLYFLLINGWDLPALVVAGAITLALMMACGLCALSWRRDI